MADVKEGNEANLGAAQDSWAALLRPESASLPLDERLRRATALAQSPRMALNKAWGPAAPLGLAAGAGLWDMVIPMSKMGFDDPMETSVSFNGPMALAIQELGERPELGGILKELLKGGASHEQKTGAFNAALRANNPATLRAIHEAGFGRFNKVARWERALDGFSSSLFEPPSQRHIETLKGLLALGMPPDIILNQDKRLPFACVERYRSDALRELLAAGASPDMKGKDGFALLSLACSMGDRGSVNALLAAGASVTVKDSESRSPLELVVKCAMMVDDNPKMGERMIEAYCEIAGALLAAGADPSEPGSDSVSAVERLNARLKSGGGQATERFAALIQARQDAMELETSIQAGPAKSAIRI